MGNQWKSCTGMTSCCREAGNGRRTLVRKAGLEIGARSHWILSVSPFLRFTPVVANRVELNMSLVGYLY
ncbi:hypothetical protein [Nostoc sp.]|uniref:hypothetical protein n=1 Tax=Nostoc sp. TaxID=1180 RepID=UPI003593BDD8